MTSDTFKIEHLKKPSQFKQFIPSFTNSPSHAFQTIFPNNYNSTITDIDI